MPGLVLTARRAARRTVDAARLTAVRRGLRRLPAADVCVCWDLDNTLVGSGVLLRAGRSLATAVGSAEPVPGMLAFAHALRDGLPGATHAVVSVRTPSMRADTLAWLRRHGVEVPDRAVFLVPRPRSKVAVWRDLARRYARVVVVDDLSHGHERPELSRYDDLIAAARRSAHTYVGLDEIEAIAADPGSAVAAADAVARRVSA